MLQGSRAAGLGLRVRPSGGNGGLWVVGAVPEGPADRLGLNRGDIIMWACLGVTRPGMGRDEVDELFDRLGAQFSMLVGRAGVLGDEGMQFVRLAVHQEAPGNEQIGIEVAAGTPGKLPRVARVLVGTAADEAGVRSGDVLLGIGIEKVGAHSISSLMGAQDSWVLIGVRQRGAGEDALQPAGWDQSGIAWLRLPREIGMPVLLQRKAEISVKDTSLSIASILPLPSVSPASVLGTPASLRRGVRSPDKSILGLEADFALADESEGGAPEVAAEAVPPPLSSESPRQRPQRGIRVDTLTRKASNLGAEQIHSRVAGEEGRGGGPGGSESVSSSLDPQRARSLPRNAARPHGRAPAMASSPSSSDSERPAWLQSKSRRSPRHSAAERREPGGRGGQAASLEQGRKRAARWLSRESVTAEGRKLQGKIFAKSTETWYPTRHVH